MKNKKHCCISVSWKNENFLLTKAFFDTIILAQALLYIFLDFLNLVLHSYRQSEHNTINLFSKAFIPMTNIAEISEVPARRFYLAVLKNFAKSEENTCV